MTNPISSILAIGGQTIGNDNFYEVRIENDASGNPLYVGRSPIANADPALSVWFITKMEYDVNSFLDHMQQPDNGSGFIYAWNDRATYFS